MVLSGLSHELLEDRKLEGKTLYTGCRDSEAINSFNPKFDFSSLFKVFDEEATLRSL